MKIFGIGFQRTGTGSLHRALTLLGFRSIHNAQMLFENPRHPIVDMYDAFSDNPVPLIYRELDQLYPGSKFIFTDRDVDAWLRSVEWLFTTGRVKNRWDEKPVVDRIHQAIYGRTDFDAEVFRERYLAHRADVLAYFANRPSDLLVVDISNQGGWKQICTFLDRPIPSQPFPHAHSSTLRRPLSPLRRTLRALGALGRVLSAPFKRKS
jgi:hypothetical protein